MNTYLVLLDGTVDLLRLRSSHTHVAAKAIAEKISTQQKAGGAGSSSAYLDSSRHDARQDAKNDANPYRPQCVYLQQPFKCPGSPVHIRYLVFFLIFFAFQHYLWSLLRFSRLSLWGDRTLIVATSQCAKRQRPLILMSATGKPVISDQESNCRHCGQILEPLYSHASKPNIGSSLLASRT